MDPSITWWNEKLPAPKRQAAAVGHALVMCAALPPKIAHASDTVVSVALLEDWLVQMRLLAEFFGIAGRATRQDFSCEAFGGTRANDAELNEVWVTATRHVVHFSHERTPLDISQIEAFDTSLANLNRLTARMLDVADSFVRTLEASGQAEAAPFRLHLDEARSALTEVSGPLGQSAEQDAQWFEYAKWLYEQQASRFASHGTQAMALLGVLAILLTLLLQAQIWTPLTLASSALLIMAAIGSVAALVPWKLQTLDLKAIASRYEDFHMRTHSDMLPLEASRLMCSDDEEQVAPIISLMAAADTRGRIFRGSLVVGVAAVALLGAQVVLSGWETAYGG